MSEKWETLKDLEIERETSGDGSCIMLRLRNPAGIAVGFVTIGAFNMDRAEEFADFICEAFTSGVLR